MTIPAAPLVAGRVSVTEMLCELAKVRPVFHSEADLQYSFARLLWEKAPEVHARLEARQPGEAREYLDVLCIGPESQTAIEFKYWTRRWTGAAGDPVEEYDLKYHAATDLVRRNFVFDIERLERFGTGRNQNGLAIILTNDESLWVVPQEGRAPTRDRDFRIHEGRTVTGTLLWGGGDYPGNTRMLAGRYDLAWHPYSELPGPNGSFRYLVVETLASRARS